MSGEALDSVLEVASNAQFVLLFWVYIRKRIFGEKLSRRWRATYHYGTWTWFVTDLSWIMCDGFDVGDWFALPLAGVTFWLFHRHDDWDDEDRRALEHGARGWVERFGNRLRVVAPAPSS